MVDEALGQCRGAVPGLELTLLNGVIWRQHCRVQSHVRDEVECWHDLDVLTAIHLSDEGSNVLRTVLLCDVLGVASFARELLYAYGYHGLFFYCRARVLRISPLRSSSADHAWPDLYMCM